MQAATAQTADRPVDRPADHKDNLFGVCAAIGEDFGFDPLWLRLALGAGLIVNFAAVVGAYFVLGAIVLVSRLAVPDRRPIQTDAADARPHAVVTSSQDLDAVALAKAA